MPHVQSVAPYVEGKAQFIWGKGEHGNKVVIECGIALFAKRKKYRFRIKWPAEV